MVVQPRNWLISVLVLLVTLVIGRWSAVSAVERIIDMAALRLVPRRAQMSTIQALLAPVDSLQHQGDAPRPSRTSKYLFTQHRPRPYSIVVVDMAEFSRRDNRFQLRLRLGLREVMRYAAEETGIMRSRLVVEDRGDGMILLVPSTVSKVSLATHFVNRLTAALLDHNEMASESARIQMRMALHSGEIYQDEHGWVGRDLNIACHLVNSAPAYSALQQFPDHVLVMIVSPTIYQAVMKHMSPTVDPATYRAARIAQKDIDLVTRLHLPCIQRDCCIERRRRSTYLSSCATSAYSPCPPTTPGVQPLPALAEGDCAGKPSACDEAATARANWM
jgi:class 3 adenylate cyclase